MSEQTSSQSKQTDDLVYQFAVGPAAWYAACGSGLYRSSDRGAAWELAYASLGAASPLTTLAVAVVGRADSALVFAGLSGGLLRSVDDGQFWERTSLPSPEPIFTVLIPSPDFARDGRLFAGTMGDGVLIYANEGRDWTMWNFGLLDANVLSLALSPRFAEDGLLYAGTEQYGLLRSTDRGQSWRRLAEGVLTNPINSIVLGARFPERPELLVLHGEHLLYSADSGDTWAAWRDERLAGLEITAVAAPQGFGGDAAVLVGLAGGEIRLV